jgi:hypothetical protein
LCLQRWRASGWCHVPEHQQARRRTLRVAKRRQPSLISEGAFALPIVRLQSLCAEAIEEAQALTDGARKPRPRLGSETPAGGKISAAA